MDVDTHNHRRFWIILILVVVMAVAGVGSVYWWQHEQVEDLNNQVAKLKQTQLPQKQFTSIEDCYKNGGKSLYTLNGQFSACLGGKVEDGEDYQAFLQYSAQNLPRINERKISKTDNQVVSSDGHSADLVAFLKRDYTGCEIGQSEDSVKGYYRILKEVSSRYALLNYGCTNDQSALKGQYFIIVCTTVI